MTSQSFRRPLYTFLDGTPQVNTDPPLGEFKSLADGVHCDTHCSHVTIAHR
jgi:hypothetical protein